mgnify:CR=1 FL=1
MITPEAPAPLAPGDVVRLKSGGPKMTVVTVGYAPSPSQEGMARVNVVYAHDSAGDRSPVWGDFPACALERA